jgi:hypothetical protein
VEPTEAFPGVPLWEKFADACKFAEAVRNRALEQATRERDQVINRLPVWKCSSPDRVRAAAIARYKEKVTAAQTKCDADCQEAEKDLMTALDQREAQKA